MLVSALFLSYPSVNMYIMHVVTSYPNYLLSFFMHHYLAREQLEGTASADLCDVTRLIFSRRGKVKQWL